MKLNGSTYSNVGPLVTSSGGVQCESPLKQSEVERALSQQQNNIEDLQENIRTLHARLKAVLTAVPESGEGKSKRPQMCCELTEEIEKRTDRIRDARASISDILERLAL